MNHVLGMKSGTSYTLDPQALLGQGVEGKVYRSGKTRCVKVYKAELSDEEVAKTEALAGLSKKIPGFAWPLELVCEEPSGKNVGYAMELLEGESLETLMSDRRTADIPPLTKFKIALEISRDVATAHALRGPKIVLGDVIKAANLVICENKATASFVDAAAVSVFGFRVARGDVRSSTSHLTTPGYVPREVLENPQAVPSQSSDLFALGVVLFELLTGHPPHEPKPCPAAIGLEPDDAVRRGIFPRWSRHPEFEEPTYDPIKIPDEIDNLFRSTFLSSGVRPSAILWCLTLEAHLAELQPPGPPDQSPSPLPTAPTRNWVVLERIIGVAIVIFLAVQGLTWARKTAAAPPAATVELPRPPRTRVGPPIMRKLFE